MNKQFNAFYRRTKENQPRLHAYLIKKFLIGAAHQNIHIAGIFIQISSTKKSFNITEFDSFEIIPTSDMFSNLKS